MKVMPEKNEYSTGLVEEKWATSYIMETNAVAYSCGLVCAQ
jgi:hypothetical protein